MIDVPPGDQDPMCLGMIFDLRFHEHIGPRLRSRGGGIGQTTVNALRLRVRYVSNRWNYRTHYIYPPYKFHVKDLPINLMYEKICVLDLCACWDMKKNNQLN